MESKKLNEEINVFHNGVRNGSEKFIAYSSSHPEWEFPCVLYNRASGSLDTFVCAINNGAPTLYEFSVNGKKVAVDPAAPEIHLTVKNEGDAACKILFEKENEPAVVLGCEDMASENRVKALYLFARTGGFTHLCIYDEACGITGLSLFSTNVSAANLITSLFTKCMQCYNMDIEGFCERININGN